MVARKPMQGVGVGAFDAAFPPEHWEKKDTLLIEHNGIDTVFTLYRRSIERSINPTALIVEMVYGESIKWTVTSRGNLWDLQKEFDALRKSWGWEIPDSCGVGYASFEKAYPPEKWEGVESFGTKADIEYHLLAETPIRPNSPAAVITCWNEPDMGFHWKVETTGRLKDQQESLGRFRAAMEYIPPKPVDPYAENPRYGRF